MGLVTVAAAVVFSTLPANRATAASDFPPLTGAVVDNAHILSDATHRTLIDELSQLRDQTGHDLVVVTVASLNGRDIAAYGIDLFRSWQVGRKGLNDGVVLLIAPNEHRDRIEVGYGLEAILTDAQSGIILRDTVRPYMKAGDYDDAALSGERAIAAVIGGGGTAVPSAALRPSPITWWEKVLIAMLVSALVFGLKVLIAAIREGLARRKDRKSKHSAWDGVQDSNGVAISELASAGSSDSSGSSSVDTGGSAGGGGASDSW